MNFGLFWFRTTWEWVNDDIFGIFPSALTAPPAINGEPRVHSFFTDQTSSHALVFYLHAEISLSTGSLSEFIC